MAPNDFNKEQILFMIIHKAKKWIPVSNFFLLVFLLLKLIGFLMLTHDYTLVSDDTASKFLVTNILRHLCYYQDLKTSTDMLSMDYNILCFILYAVILLPLLVCYFIYRSEVKKNNPVCELSKSHKLLCKCSGFIFILTHLFFQHVIEILFFIFLHTFVNSTDSTTFTDVSSVVRENFSTFDKSLLLNRYIFCFLNIGFIVILNVSLFHYFRFLNEPFFNSTYSFKFIHNNPLIISMVLLFDLQGLQCYSLAFINKTAMNLQLLLSCVAMTLSVGVILSNAFKYTFSMMGLTVGMFLVLIGFFSSLLDIIIFQSSTNPLSDSQTYMKLLIEILFAVTASFTILKVKKNYYKNNIQLYIFKKHKNLDKSTIYAFIEYFYYCIEDGANFIDFFNLIYSHQNKCTTENCACANFRFMKYQSVIIESVWLENTKEEVKMEKYSEIFTDFLSLCESEIVNTIHQINKSQNLKDFSLLILYFDFVFHFKRNPSFANYLIEQFLKTKKNIPFLFRYYFYVYKLKVMKFSKGLVKKVKYSQEFHFYQFIEYQKILENIDKLILDTLEGYSAFLAIKAKHSETFKSRIVSDTRENYNKIEYIYAVSKKLNENYEKILKLIENNFSTISLKNSEACYKLTEYFKIIGQPIPLEISTYFNKVNSYYETLRESSVYTDRQMHQPLIVVLDKNDNYIIKFVSQKLCDYLNYKRSEVIEQDFHMFIPPEFLQEHKVIIQKIIFKDNLNFFVKQTFMLTKDNYYIPVELSVVLMPSLNDKMKFILNIRFKNKQNEKQKHYELVLDYGTNFICFAKNFETHFGFNKDMLNKLKLNFATLFNLDLNLYGKKIESCLSQVKNLDMESLENITKIFRNFDLQKAIKSNKEFKRMSLFGIENFKSISMNRLLIFNKRKDRILPSVMKIRKFAEDLELEKEMINNILKLEKNLYRYTTVYKLNDIKLMMSSRIKHSFNYYQIKLAICNLGNIPYYLARIYDLTNKKLPIKIETETVFDPAKSFYFNYNNTATATASPSRSTVPQKTLINVNPRGNDNNTMQMYNSSIKNRNTGETPMNSKIKLTPTPGFPYYQNNNSLEGESPILSPFLKKMSIIDNFHKAGDMTPINGVTNQYANASGHNSTLHNQSLIPLNDMTPSMNPPNTPNKKNHTIVNKIKEINKIKSKEFNKETKIETQHEKIIFSLSAILLVLLIGLSIINFLLKADHIQTSQIFSNINFYNMRAKSSLFFTSALVLLGCTKVDALDSPEYDNMKVSNEYLSTLFNKYSEDLMYNYYYFEYYMRKTAKGQDIEAVINEKFDYQILYNDWSSFIRPASNINDEIKLYHYYISNLEDSKKYFDKCRVKDFFINQIQKQGEFNSDLEQNKATFVETILYYVINNVFKNLRSSFDNISLTSDQLMTTYLKANQLSATAFNISILIVAVALIIDCFLLFRNYRNRLKILMNKFYLNYSREVTLKSSLESLKLILLNFDRSECEEHEKTKHNKIGHASGIAKANKTGSIKKERDKRRTILPTNVNNKNTESKLDRTNISLSPLINNSANTTNNNVSVATNNDADPTKNLNRNNCSLLKMADVMSFYNVQMKGNTGKHTIEEEDKELEENNQELKIVLIKYGTAILIISFVIFLGIVLANSFINISEIDELILSTQISINFIERISRLVGMILYFKLSVIENNPNYIMTPPSDYINREYGNYFKINIDYNSDSIYTILGSSEFAHLHYQLFLNIDNINAFMLDQKLAYILPNVRDYETSLRIDKNFCYYLAYGIPLFNPQEDFLKDFASMNNELKLCLQFGDEVKSHGINAAFELIVTSLRNMYLDFFLDKTQPKDIVRHLSQQKLVQLFNGITVIFNKLQHNFFHLLETDLNALYDSIISTEFYFSISLLVFNFLFIGIIIIFFIIKFEAYHSELSCAIKKYRKATK